MAIVLSDQLQNIADQDVKFNSGVNTDGARVRIKYFSITLAAAAIADTVSLLKLPAGARILGGRAQTAATLGTSSTLAFGTGTALQDGAGGTLAAGAANLKAAAATTSAVNFELAATALLGSGALTTGRAETLVYATVAGGAVTGELTGWVSYSQN